MAKKTNEELLQELANYWRARSGLDWVMFDGLFGKPWPEGVKFGRVPRNWATDASYKEILQDISWHIMRGFPLTFEEFHVACGAGLLLADLDYLTFFKTRWYETATEVGYGDPPAGQLKPVPVPVEDQRKLWIFTHVASDYTESYPVFYAGQIDDEQGKLARVDAICTAYDIDFKQDEDDWDGFDFAGPYKLEEIVTLASPEEPHDK